MEIFQYAINRTRSEHFLTFTLARLFGNRSIIKYFYLFYVYMRIVDDKIDDELNNSGDRVDYLNSQIELLKTGFKQNETGDKTLETQIVHAIKIFDRKYDGFITERLLRMMDVFQFDVNRLGQYISREKLFKYFYIEARVSLEIILFFIVADTSLDIKQTVELGFTSKLIHTIRDLEEDLADEIINIPEEYKNNRRGWFRAAADLIRKKNKTGYRALFKVKNFRYGLVCIVNTVRYKWELGSVFHPGFKLFNKLAFLMESFFKITGYSIKYLFTSRRYT